MPVRKDILDVVKSGMASYLHGKVSFAPDVIFTDEFGRRYIYLILSTIYVGEKIWEVVYVGQTSNPHKRNVITDLRSRFSDLKNKSLCMFVVDVCHHRDAERLEGEYIYFFSGFNYENGFQPLLNKAKAPIGQIVPRGQIPIILKRYTKEVLDVEEIKARALEEIKARALEEIKACKEEIKARALEEIKARKEEIKARALKEIKARKEAEARKEARELEKMEALEAEARKEAREAEEMESLEALEAKARKEAREAGARKEAREAEARAHKEARDAEVRKGAEARKAEADRIKRKARDAEVRKGAEARKAEADRIKRKVLELGKETGVLTFGYILRKLKLEYDRYSWKLVENVLRDCGFKKVRYHAKKKDYYVTPCWNKEFVTKKR